MHHYLHNATGSHSPCALNSKSTVKFCTEYKILPPPIQQKPIIPFVFPHNGLWIIVIWGWGGWREKRPSYLPFPVFVSASSLWIIDYRWEQEFALQGGGYKAAWGQRGRAKISLLPGLSKTLGEVSSAWLFITAVLSLKATLWRTWLFNIQCHSFQYDKQLGPAIFGSSLAKYVVTQPVERSAVVHLTHFIPPVPGLAAFMLVMLDPQLVGSDNGWLPG